ncbi:MAG: GIY-YIG nuclease family protein [Gammaproteobacteria bacterium]|nr:GIY-YIG nuclease family protein [Gammaproteobacteria bacterium]
MRTYQLFIELAKDTEIQVGKLGKFSFPAGNYVYTGSARKNMEARIQRHFSKDKRLRWHIDYLLNSPHAQITDSRLSKKEECALNQQTNGEIIVPRFGASDCKNGCGSHLKYFQ